MGPIVVSGDPRISPRESISLMRSKLALLGSTAGGSAPNTGHCATMT